MCQCDRIDIAVAVPLPYLSSPSPARRPLCLKEARRTERRRDAPPLLLSSSSPLSPSHLPAPSAQPHHHSSPPRPARAPRRWVVWLRGGGRGAANRDIGRYRGPTHGRVRCYATDSHTYARALDALASSRIRPPAWAAPTGPLHVTTPSPRHRPSTATRRAAPWAWTTHTRWCATQR